MTVTEQFPIGCKVRVSASGRRFVPLRALTGIVVGYSRNRESLRVKRDGRVAVITTMPEHWERDA